MSDDTPPATEPVEEPAAAEEPASELEPAPEPNPAPEPEPASAGGSAPRFTRGRLVAFSALALVGFFLLSEAILFGVSRVAYYVTVTRYNPPTAPAAAADGSRKYRIVTFGDSVTAGQGTAPRYSYPRQLEELLNASNPGERFEVINNGVYALNSSRTADLLPGWLDEFQPDLIVVMSGCNNAWNYTNSHLKHLGLLNRKPWQVALNKTRTYRFLRVLLKRQKAGFGIAEEQNLTPVLRDQMQISETVRPAVDPTAATLERQKRIFDDENALNELLEYDLGKIRDAVRAKDVQIILMTYPFVPPYQDHRGITRRFAQSNKVIGVDNFGEFQKIKATNPGLDLFSADRGHPNATGYRVIAAAIQQAMHENQDQLGMEVARPPDPLAAFKDPEYLAGLWAEVSASAARPDADEYVWETLGHVAVEMERWEDAKMAFRKAFEVSGGAPQFYESLGNLMVQLGECDQLEALRQEMLSQRGSRSDIQFLLDMFQNACAGGNGGPPGWGQGGEQRDGRGGGPQGGPGPN